MLKNFRFVLNSNSIIALYSSKCSRFGFNCILFYKRSLKGDAKNFRLQEKIYNLIMMLL